MEGTNSEISKAGKGAVLDPKDLQTTLERHEREHGCRALSTQIRDGRISDIQCVPWPGFNSYVVDVWNCQPRLCVEVRKGFSTSHEDVDVPAGLEDEVREILAEDVEAAGGAINISGWYPLLEKYARKLMKLGAIKPGG